MTFLGNKREGSSSPQRSKEIQQHKTARRDNKVLRQQLKQPFLIHEAVFRNLVWAAGQITDPRMTECAFEMLPTNGPFQRLQSRTSAPKAAFCLENLLRKASSPAPQGGKYSSRQSSNMRTGKTNTSQEPRCCTWRTNIKFHGSSFNLVTGGSNCRRTLTGTIPTRVCLCKHSNGPKVTSSKPLHSRQMMPPTRNFHLAQKFPFNSQVIPRHLILATFALHKTHFIDDSS